MGWEQIFAGETKLTFRLEEIVVLETVGMALQSAIEQVSVGDEAAPRGTAIASNVFLRTPSGWRMVSHHASPAPTMTVSTPAGPLWSGGAPPGGGPRVAGLDGELRVDACGRHATHLIPE